MVKLNAVPGSVSPGNTSNGSICYDSRAVGLSIEADNIGPLHALIDNRFQPVIRVRYYRAVDFRWGRFTYVRI
jgi:hypothetical protein